MRSFQEHLQAETLEGTSAGVILMTGKASYYGAGPRSPKGNSSLGSKSAPVTNFLVTF